MRRNNKIASVGAVILALAAGLSACGDSDDANGSGADGSIKLMVIGELSSPVLAFPEIETGAEAAVAEINRAGGVNGHQIELLTCNTQTDPNVATSCARKAVSENVSAVVGMLSLNSDAIMSVLKTANIPTIGGTALGSLDFTSPNSFPIISSPVSAVATVLAMPGYQDCEHPAVLATNNPPSLDSAERIKKVYSDLGTETTVVQINIDVTDIRPQVATLLSGGTDCVFTSVSPQAAISLVKEAAASGSTAKISQLMSVTPVESLRQLGDAAQGMYASTPFLVEGASEAGTTFADEMREIDPEAKLTDHAEAAYTGVKIFAAAAGSLNDFSAANVLEALNSVQSLDVGTIAPLDGYPADSGIAGLPRVNVTKLYGYVFDGQDFKLVQPEPFDIRPGL